MHRKIAADYHILAEKWVIHWFGQETPPSIKTKTLWKCAKGHQWEARYNDIQQGHGCPICAGNLPRTPADYHASAQTNEFEWLGPEVSNTRTKTKWRCKNGHIWEARFNSIQRGDGCPFCAGLVRKTPADYHKLAEEKGIRWVGDEVPNVGTHTKWECAQGHQWVTTYNAIQQGYNCRICAINKQAEKQRKKPSDYIALAEAKRFKWLGPVVPKVSIATGWECEMGHQWMARYSDIRKGHGCPSCAGTSPKTSADYHAVAEKNGFEWLGYEVPTTSAKTVWRCKQSHVWEAPYSTIQQGHGCPHCAGLSVKTPADYHALAELKRYKWLGPEVPNIKTETEWECEKGHRWMGRYNDIQQGHGCPICVNSVQGVPVSQVQQALHEMLGGELNYPWGRYRIDVALKKDYIYIAVEYDSWFWHSHKQDYDLQRDKELIDANWRVLRIKSRQLLPSQEQLEAAITRLCNGESKVEIILADWGKGSTRAEYD